MNVIIRPRKLSGTVEAPSSKSAIQRAAVCALASKAKTRIYHNCRSNDIVTLFSCISSIGAEITKGNGYTEITPKAFPELISIFCGESGAVSRFLIPFASAVCPDVFADGLPSLRRRPFAELISVMREHGCVIDSDYLPIHIEGMLKAGEYRIRGDISSQYISGLLMSLPMLSSPSRIFIQGKLMSAGYIDMTLSMLRRFGIWTAIEDNIFYISPSDYISPGEINAEGDWSGAAYIYACGSDITVTGLDNDSLQRDKAILSVIEEIRELDGDELTIDVTDIPDLVPAIAACASISYGEVRITGAERLRLKESDRLEATKITLESMGSDINICGNELYIKGTECLHGAELSSFGDHRIVMAAAAAAALSAEKNGDFDGILVIKDAQAVNKSYPEFFEHYRKLGGDVSYEF